MLDTEALDAGALREAFGRFATGVTVVTLRDGAGRPTGVTVNSFASLSLEPPLCLFALGLRQRSLRWLEPDAAFAVNVLRHDQAELAWQFAKPRDDKFAGVAATEGRGGAPRLHGAIAWFECRVAALHPGGDHRIVVGEVLGVATAPGRPLLFSDGALRGLDT